MIHSISAWQSFHGPIEFVTDHEGGRWLERLGLAELYDSVDDEGVQDIDPTVFNPVIFAPFAKVIALAGRSAPVALMDTDFYLKAPIPDLERTPFVCAHLEAVGNAVYPPAADVPDPNGVIDPRWDFTQPACNMAFAWFGSEGHREAMTRVALAFAAGNDAPPRETDSWPRAVFAEQRIARFTAEDVGVGCRTLLDAIWDPGMNAWAGTPDPDLFHHTWHEKHWFTAEEAAACARVEIAALLARFPERRPLLERLSRHGLFDAVPDPFDAVLPAR